MYILSHAMQSLLSSSFHLYCCECAMIVLVVESAFDSLAKQKFSLMTNSIQFNCWRCIFRLLSAKMIVVVVSILKNECRNKNAYLETCWAHCCTKLNTLIASKLSLHVITLQRKQCCHENQHIVLFHLFRSMWMSCLTAHETRAQKNKS